MSENLKLCGECGGRCCMKYPGLPRPADMGKTSREIGRGLRTVLGTRGWTLDYWEPDGELPQVYFPRPKAGDDLPGILNAGWGGPCHLLNGDGCSLSYEQRPFGCRDLMPAANYPEDCASETASRKVDEVALWRPYQRIIKRIIKSKESK